MNYKTKESIYFRCIVMGCYRILYYKDNQWVRDNIFILLKEKETKRFRATWEGMLTFSPMIYKEVAGYLHDYYLYALNRLDEYSEKLKKQFVNSLGIILIYSVENPNEIFIPTLFENSSSSLRCSFLRKIEMILKNMTKMEREEVWRKWLFTFIHNSTQNIPIKLNDDEKLCVLKWIAYSESYITELIDEIIQFKQIKLNNSHDFNMILEDLYNCDVLDNKNTEKIKLLTYLLQCDFNISFSSHEVYDFYNSIKFSDNDIEKQAEIIDLSLKKGIDLQKK